MPRIRTIKPEFWDSPDTARASLRARLFYIAMWNWADDYGKGTASAKQLIGFAFPNDDDVTVADYPSLAKDVADCFGVVFYVADRRPYFYIPAFDLHQRTEKRAVSRIPDPPEDIAAGQAPFHEPSASSSGSSDTAEGSSVPGTGEQGNRGTGEREQGKTLSRDALVDVDALFDAFWDAYDKKQGRKAARAKYAVALKKPGVTPDLLIGTAQAYIAWQKREGKHPEFTKNPATWLNGEHWNDERTTGPASTSTKPSTTDQRVNQGLAVARLLQQREQREQMIQPPRAIGQ